LHNYRAPIYIYGPWYRRFSNIDLYCNCNTKLPFSIDLARRH